MDNERANQHPFMTAAQAFRSYPSVGTIQRLPSKVSGDGVWLFDAMAVHYMAKREVPDDLTACDACGGGSAIDEICNEGFAIFRCTGCGVRFRVIDEFDYFFQEVISE